MFKSIKFAFLIIIFTCLYSNYATGDEYMDNIPTPDLTSFFGNVIQQTEDEDAIYNIVKYKNPDLLDSTYYTVEQSYKNNDPEAKWIWHPEAILRWHHLETCRYVVLNILADDDFLYIVFNELAPASSPTFVLAKYIKGKQPIYIWDTEFASGINQGDLNEIKLFRDIEGNIGCTLVLQSGERKSYYYDSEGKFIP
jgi:hypothetical protein